MSNATYTSQSSQAVTQAAGQVDHENPSPAGVRKVLEAYAEREVQRVRWKAVFAGLFLAMSTQILLGLLGLAVGLTSIGARAATPLAVITAGRGAWTFVSTLVALFVGGYSAAKLGGSIRRGDGVVSGILTWSLSLMVGVLLAIASVGALSSASQSAGGPVDEPRIERPVQVRAAAQGAWFAFGGALLSLVTAMIGGAVGSVGSISQDVSARRKEIRRREQELEQAREQLRQEEEKRQ